jgi:hypothetical protein
MQCPSCSAELSKLAAGDLELDVCQNGCGGIWFDRNELFSFDEKREFDPSTLLRIAKAKEQVKVDPNQRKRCPTCSDQPLVRQFFDVKCEVEFDQCWECGGVWLDVGEINTIRSQFETHADRTKASNEYIVEKLKEAQAAMDQHTLMKLQALDARLKWNPIAQAMRLFQVMIGVEGRTDRILAEQIFRPDFDKLLK